MKSINAKNLLAAAAVLAITGCTANQPADKKWQDPFFPTESKKNSVDLMFEHSTAVAAAEDSTLYPMHFDGDELNSLGKKKLAAIVQARKKNVPVTVYLDASDEAEHNARRVAMVEQTLQAYGIYGSDGKVETGANPAVSTSAAPAVKFLKGTKTSDAAGAEGAAPAGPTP
ncbi:MAG: hypothetical protein QM770_23945 [Tepidisphaeraceae bacterium]